MEHYVIVSDCKEYYEGSVDILGIAHSLEGAKEFFEKAVINFRERADKNDFDVIDDTDVYFYAECEEEWSGNYIKLYVQKV